MVVNLIALHSQTKQAHRNVEGPSFEPAHRVLDEMAGAYQAAVDELAERMLALGEPADGRLATVQWETVLDEFPAGLIQDREVIRLMVERVSTMVRPARESQESVADQEAVSEDLLLELLHTP